MQIFPNGANTIGVNSLFSTNTSSSSTGSFSAFLDLAQNSVKHDLQKNEDYSTSEPLSEAPYSSSSEANAALYSIDEVGFTKNELFQLHQDLIRAGAKAEYLDNLRTLIDKPDGANISQVLASLNQESTQVALTENEQLSLTSLLSKIDSTGELEANVNSLLANGEGLSAMSAISQQLLSMDQDYNISVSKTEIAALGKALGLSEQGLSQLMSGFGSFKSFDLNASGVQKLLSSAQANLAEESLNQDKLQKALEATLGPILQKASERFKDAQDAASLLSKNAQHSDILIKETVTKNAINGLEQTVTGEKSPVPTQNIANKDGHTLQNEHTKGLNIENTQAAKNANGQALINENIQNAKTDSSNTQDNKKDTSWDALLGKVEVQQTASKSDVSFSGLMGLQNSENPVLNENTAKNMPNTPPKLGHNEQRIANQVERGLLSAMQNGSKKLELQLNPDDLGTINLILTSSRTGEISASIRTDRSETAEVMQRQLDIIRVNLEQQGIKVEKLDVQYEAQDKQKNDPWNDLQQHNNQQEQHARQEQLERLRTLRTLRNSGTNSEDVNLAQNMQADSISANNSTTNLHIVA